MEPPADDFDQTTKKAEWALSDLLKKALLTGSSALFMTEEGLRSLLGDLTLPKDVVQFAVNQVSKTKEELFKVLSVEVRQFLESTKMIEQIRELLSTLSLEINTKVRFVVQDDKIQPKTETSVKIVNADPPKTKRTRKP